jgi:hypothetical protein
MVTNPKSATTEKARSSRLPILLSAFVMPGAGQFMQRRWAAAWLCALGFLFSFIMFACYAVRVLTAYYALWLKFDNYQAAPMPFKALGAWFLISMAIYVAGLVDTFAAQIRAHSRSAAAKVLKPETEACRR